MGIYVNPTGRSFELAINSEIFVDKSGLIKETNKCINTLQRYMCVSRPRRFGKSMAMDMLSAYYGRKTDAENLFKGLKISHDESYDRHINKYDVLKINMQDFLSVTHSVDDMLKMLCEYITDDFSIECKDIIFRDKSNIVRVMQDVFMSTGRPFVILIDEWDCLFREFTQDKEAQKKYLDFLRGWLKDKDYIALAYMTGILPIKKYGSHSALNMFTEYSMTDMGALAEYFGFTDDEVKQLCKKYDRDYEAVKNWYDGYMLSGKHVYNPKAVVSVMMRGSFQSYWSQTGTYESLIPLIDMDFDGLRAAIISMISGNEIKVRTTTFQNDMVSFKNKDDVLTLLIHLGYLAFNQKNQMAYIPNEELRNELMDAVEENKWDEIIQFERQSIDLFNATINKDVNTVAAKIEQIHMEYTSVIQYNDENSLSSVLAIAYLGTMNYYFKPVRELPTGRGFADFVYIPKPEYINDYPALVVELKWNKNADTAMQQIRERQYPNSLLQYTGNVLLVAINYDEKTKEQVCKIEEYAKIQN